MIWSILLCGLPERYHTAQELLYSLLESQAVARRPEVELLYVMDNRRRTVGAKRNALLDMAQGEYVSFIDDDDSVASDYVQKIVSIIARVRKQDPPVDVICFGQRATLNPHGVIHECSYSLSHYRERPPEQRRQLAQSGQPNTLLWTGPPAHTMIWRREAIKECRFPEANFGEDVSWVDQACERARTEVILTGDPLYFYRYSEEGTATR